jgi:glycerol uptake facilitator-like aquaporin
MAGTPVRTARFRRTVGGELLAEFLGTLVLIAWGWALAVTFDVYVAGGVSGAPINPRSPSRWPSSGR